MDQTCLYTTTVWFFALSIPLGCLIGGLLYGVHRTQKKFMNARWQNNQRRFEARYGEQQRMRER